MRFFKIFLIALVIALVVFRLCLPHYLLQYVLKQINKLPDYHATIEDLDVSLYRGSYTIKDIKLWKRSTHLPVPYFAAQTIDFSVEWRAILQGKLVAKVITENPVVNFVTDPNKYAEQLTIDERWLDIIKTLYPLNINRFEARDGMVYYRSFHGNPPFDTYMKNIHFLIENMQNADHDPKLLSSTFQFSGDPMDGGSMKANGKFNPFTKTPTFYLKTELLSLSIVQIAPLLKHFSDIDVTAGKFSLYGEVAAANNNISGYVKPFFKNLKIGDPKKESPIGMVYNGLAAVAAKVLENSSKKTVATKINLSGRIDDPHTSIFSILGYMLHHAFIQALLPGLDKSVKMQDVIYGKPTTDFPTYRTTSKADHT